MDDHYASKGTYQGEPCVWLRRGRYEAALLPEAGGNLIAFRDVERGYSFLNEPEKQDMESFKVRPYIYGIPVLFPPNRYEDGAFRWNGTTYQLPVNDVRYGNHLHGFVHNIPWQLAEYGVTTLESYAVVTLTFDEGHPMYAHFPHCFTIRLRYRVSDQGLSQHVMIRNEGGTPLPCSLGFHTSIRVPYAPGSTSEDYRMKITVGDRWELNERQLPTGRVQEPSAWDQRLQQQGVPPFEQAMNHHYTARPLEGRNRAEFTDTREGVTLVYDAGTAYQQWMLYNNLESEGFVCPEPQVHMVNAPNMDLPANETGLFALAQGEIWEETSRLYIRNS